MKPWPCASTSSSLKRTRIRDGSLLRSLKRRGLKTRALSQVVSPASATYLMGGDVCLKANEDIEYREARPYAAVALSPATGYTLVTAAVDARE